MSMKETFPVSLPISIHDEPEDSRWYQGRAFLTYDDMRSLLDIMESWLDLTKDDVVRKKMQIDCRKLFEKDLKFCNKFYRKLVNVVAEINMNDKPRIRPPRNIQDQNEIEKTF